MKSEIGIIDFQSEINEKLLSKNSNYSHTEIDPNTFRASSVGYCKRQILVKKLGLEVFDSETQGRFQVGDFIHDWIQENILRKYPVMYENQVVYEGSDIRIVGHYDCYDPIDEVVYDFKSRSSWYKFNPPEERHLQQLEVYMRALGIKNGLMVYVSKSDLTVETYPDHFGRSKERDLDNLQEDLMTVTTNEKRFDKVLKKCYKVRKSLLDNGLPESAEDVDEMFSKCGDCLGCQFEDKENWDFSHLEGMDLTS